ncbi:uncharacterized protein FIBRA_08342 [Fibroporia radiculosa]|uniref:Uncharacterized protein n=1 Tax=Fibroporia radiculosa TaxID=599839 RepID=J4GWM1_9APHY|nr:uncharacterized protein FIBRA_08342 [Fibroporia radiculosa]CCM06095.1 predicted protein [Fibroporia radiculosa]
MSAPASNGTQSSQGAVSYATSFSSSPRIITTTIYSGTPLPTGSTAAGSSSKSSVPVAAIAGGTAGGVFLAVAIVVIWTWWGRCIKRQRDRDRKEALANMQVKENTRRNAASASYTHLPPSSASSRNARRVTFVPSTSSSTQTTLKAYTDEPKLSLSRDVPPLQSGSLPPYRPARPSPLAQGSPRNEQAPLLHGSPHSEPRSPVDPAPSPSVQPFVKRSLAHKRSAASSISAYSAESGEERQTRVSTSLVMAALGHLDPRRSWLGNYLPLSANRHRANNDLERNRLSQMSEVSTYSQGDEMPSEPVGYAYGGEEGPGPKQSA